MKKTISILLVCMLSLISLAAAFAEETTASTVFDGVVTAGETLSIYAPYGGTMDDYAIRAGDSVQAEDVLFPISAVRVYAPCDGAITGLYAKPGDSAEYIQQTYNAMMYIEPKNGFIIDATQAEAYNDSDNRILRPGETVYIVSKSTSDREGEGFITYVNSDGFGVEITEHDLHVDENVAIHRHDDYSNTSKIGAGVTAQAPFVPVTAEGSVLKLHVTDGEKVKRGDLLMELVGGTLAAGQDLSGHIEAPTNGILTAIHVAPGAPITQDQLIATLCPSENLQVAMTVNELDLSAMEAGDSVDVTFDHDDTIVRGTIESISAKSAENLGDAEFIAYITLDKTDNLRIGMNASVQVRH